jgi:hypothetical protein
MSILDTLIGAAVALAAVWLERWLSSRADESRSREIRRMHLAALEAEIDYCGKLAGTYVTEGYAAPLYRFPKTVYETVYPTLVSDVLSETDVTSLTGFYSQVDQMNRGLDAIGRYWAEGNMGAYEKERNRLAQKAAEMRHPDQTLSRPHPESEFFNRALETVQRHGK